MIILKEKNGDIRIKKIIPSNVKTSDVITIFSKYVDQTMAKGLASIYKSAIGDKEFVVLVTESQIYELDFKYGSPSFEETEKIEKLITVLEASGLNEKETFKCISEVFFADVNVEADRRKNSEEKARIEKIAKEMPTWIPKGYKYLTGNMYEGFVVVDKYGNEFTYVPYLEIYVSRYEISLDNEGYTSSIPDRKAWVNVKYKDAYDAAINFDPDNKSDLLKGIKDIEHAIYSKTGKSYPGVVYKGNIELKTGAMPENMIYNIDCLVGNHYCMLKSKNPRTNVKAYGQSYRDYKIVNDYGKDITIDKCQSDVGFRICLRR